MKGVKHTSVGDELTKTEWESETGHDIAAGTSFPGSPSEKDLFYRTDEHKWYIYNGSSWVELTAIRYATSTGVYTGDDTVNRAIPHGLSGAPRLVFITKYASDMWYKIGGNYGIDKVHYMSPGAAGSHNVTGLNSTNFYIGNAANYGQSANASGVTYFWIAFEQ